VPVDLNLRRWGNGPRSILLLHGLTSDAAGWWRLGADLAERGWSVAAPDLRGHGASPPGEDYRLESYAADVLALGDAWDAVLGHSLGGALAVLAAVTRPGFAARMILVEPALMMAAVEPEEAMGWIGKPFTRPRTAEATLEANPTWHPEDARIKAEAVDNCSPEVARSTVYENPDWDLLAETSGLDVPTTIIGGDPACGGIVPVTIGEWFASEQPLIDYVMIRGAGHSIHREADAYGAFLEVVLAALGS
jgi:pimeloyl-ACP methyl ester carboxylesterase